MACGADILANTLLTSVTAGENFTIPNHDVSGAEFEIPGGLLNPLYQEVPKISLDALTTRNVDGAGAFDGLMAGVKVHLMEEYNAGRIVGGEYTKAYIALVQVAMGNATQFLLGRDQAYWAAVTAQIAAIMGKVQLKTASVELATAQIRAANHKAEFGLTKLKLANEDAAYCTNLKNLDVLNYNLTNMLPAQLILLKEQAEVQRAQTLDNRGDGAAVLGAVGKQKELYSQQIISYKRSSEINAAKLFTDAWISNAAINEGLELPASFTAANVSTVLTTVKNNNAL